MDVFQQRDARKLLIRGGAAGLWVQFRSAVLDLVDSYNSTEDGQAKPARVTPGETDLFINQQRGFAADAIHSISVQLAIRFNGDGFSILGHAEKWLVRNGKQIMCGEQLEYRFDVDGDPLSGNLWLALNGETYQPRQAVEKMLYRVLLGWA